MFQSPQWGSNSKAGKKEVANLFAEFQSPQWGSNSKVPIWSRMAIKAMFQSPQWGSNSKGSSKALAVSKRGVSVPAMGK